MASLVVALAPAVGRGQQDLAIVDVALEGELGPEVLDPVVDALEDGLRTAFREVIPLRVVSERMLQAGMDGPCESEECLIELGALTEADVLLRVSVTQASQLYLISAELISSEDGARLTSAEATCEVCTWTEALASITGCAEELRQALERERGAGGEEDEQRSARSHWGRSLGLWGWITGGLGVATLIPGTVLLGIDGDCLSGSEGEGGCVDRYGTWQAGLGLTLVGAALVVTSLVLLARHYRRRVPQRASRLSGFTSTASLSILP